MKATQKDKALIDTRIQVTSLGLAIYPPGASFGPRTCKDYEFVWIIDGDVTWELDGTTYPCPAGSFVLIRRGMRDSFEWDPIRQTRHAYFHFSFLKKPDALPPETDWPLVLMLPDGDIIRPLFRHVASLWEPDGAPNRPLINSAATHLFLSFIKRQVETAGEGSAALPEAVERALSYVQKQWAAGNQTPPSVDALAKAAAVSTGHLCRLFKQALGCGPIEALRLARLDRAATILARSNLRIQEISALTGFENAFHFSRCFKKVYGIPPREFRERILSGGNRPRTRLVQARRMGSRLWGQF